MNDQKLDRYLQSVGKECFVTYYELFANESLHNVDIAKQLQQERGYEWQSCQSRPSKARKIIDAGRAKDALLLIHQSKVPRDIRDQALRIANSL